MNTKTLDAAGLLLFNSGYVYRKLRKESERLSVRWTKITLLKDIELQAPVTQKKLAKINHMSGPSISIVVNEMIDSGLIKRTTNPEDRRSSTLSLTKNGQKSLDKNGKKLQECLVPILEQLSPADIDCLIRAELALAKVLAK